MCLEVFATNEKAIRMYKDFGFTEEGRRQRDIKVGAVSYVDTLAMSRFVK